MSVFRNQEPGTWDLETALANSVPGALQSGSHPSRDLNRKRTPGTKLFPIVSDEAMCPISCSISSLVSYSESSILKRTIGGRRQKDSRYKVG